MATAAFTHYHQRSEVTKLVEIKVPPCRTDDFGALVKLCATEGHRQPWVEAMNRRADLYKMEMVAKGVFGADS